MVHASAELLALKRHDYKTYASVTFGDGRTASLGPSNFSLTGNTVIDGAQSMSFPLGVAISRACSLAILNPMNPNTGTQMWDGYDFLGAVFLVEARIVVGQNVEVIPIGKFTVITPMTPGDVIQLQAQDEMWKADVPYDDTAPLTSNTLGGLYAEVCSQCNLPRCSHASESLGYDYFLHEDTPITAIPSGQTCRQILGFISMLASGNVHINRSGEVDIVSYDFSVLNEDGASGGKIHVLDQWKEVTTDTGDIVIDGVSTTVAGGVVSVGVGSASNYVLKVSNPLMIGWEEQGLALIGERILSGTFRKFSGTYFANPLIDFMDGCQITDSKGKISYSVITDCDFAFFGFTTILNSAESGIYNRSTYSTPYAETLQAAENLVAVERTARELAFDQLNTALSQSAGLYSTVEHVISGSTITQAAAYLHDKPNLDDSMDVIKITSGAIGITANGGIKVEAETTVDGVAYVTEVSGSFPFGVTVDGNAILNILSTSGINADWINAGSINVYAANGGPLLFSINFEDMTGTINENFIEGIKIGYVAREGGSPVLGVAIGQDMTVTESSDPDDPYPTITGKFRGVFTATKLAFYENDTEVAYVSNQKLNISRARVSNGLQIGDGTATSESEWEISHDDQSGFSIKWIGG